MVKNSRRKKVVIATHNGRFHADEVFALATLSIFFNGAIKIVRTRDTEKMKTADLVVDVGMVYDKRKYFDHHQLSGAGKRQNGIPFASFGLIWKHFGQKVCQDVKIALDIDKHLVQTIDAEDNGFALVRSRTDFLPYGISNIISSFNSNWDEEINRQDENFAKALKFAEELIRREVARFRSIKVAKNRFKKIYENSKDKKIIILNKNYPWQEFISDFTKVFFVIYPGEDNRWNVSAVRKNNLTFENKKSFPQSWAGKNGPELERVSGVRGALFCHKSLFLAVADSKIGAQELVKKALRAKNNFNKG